MTWFRPTTRQRTAGAAAALGCTRSSTTSAASVAASPRRRGAKPSRIGVDPALLEIRRRLFDCIKQADAGGVWSAYQECREKGALMDKNLYNAVLNSLLSCEQSDLGMQVLGHMRAARMKPDESTWLAVIRGKVGGGEYEQAFEYLREMVQQGLQPRLRGYAPILEGLCQQGQVGPAEEVWRHMEAAGVVAREDQYIQLLWAMGHSRSQEGGSSPLWQGVTSGRVDQLLEGMSYICRSLTSSQLDSLKAAFNAQPDPALAAPAPGLGEPPPGPAARVVISGPGIEEIPQELDDDEDSEQQAGDPPHRQETPTETNHNRDRSSRAEDAHHSHAKSGHDQARSSHAEDHAESGHSEADAACGHSRAEAVACPRCGSRLRAVGLNDRERERVRRAIFELAASNVKKHTRNKWTRLLARKKLARAAARNQKVPAAPLQQDPRAGEAQVLALQQFADWLDRRRAQGVVYTVVLDSHNVGYNLYQAGRSFSFQQVAAVVRELEARGERPLVIMAEKYVRRACGGTDRRSDLGTPGNRLVVQQWLDKEQLYQCPDAASDDWYWMYASVAHDPADPSALPTRALSNDLMRDHRLSLLEATPFQRWMNTQLVRFSFSHRMEENAAGPLPPLPTVILHDVPIVTRDIQCSPQGAWHFPSVDSDEWLCVDFSSHVHSPPASLSSTDAHTHTQPDSRTAQTMPARQKPAGAAQEGGADDVGGIGHTAQALGAMTVAQLRILGREMGMKTKQMTGTKAKLVQCLLDHTTAYTSP